jgi:hypothetical protein
MVCDRTLEDAAARMLAAQSPPFGLGLAPTNGVHRVEVWYAEGYYDVDFVGFRVFDAELRRKAIWIPGH